MGLFLVRVARTLHRYSYLSDLDSGTLQGSRERAEGNIHWMEAGPARFEGPDWGTAAGQYFLLPSQNCRPPSPLGKVLPLLDIPVLAP